MAAVSQELRGRYEELRNQVVTGSAGTGQGYGWALLVSRGMAAWMRACQEMRAPRAKRESGEANGNGILSLITRNDLATALAGMALGVVREATA